MNRDLEAVTKNVRNLGSAEGDHERPSFQRSLEAHNLTDRGPSSHQVEAFIDLVQL